MRWRTCSRATGRGPPTMKRYDVCQVFCRGIRAKLRCLLIPLARFDDIGLNSDSAESLDLRASSLSDLTMEVRRWWVVARSAKSPDRRQRGESHRRHSPESAGPKFGIKGTRY